MSDYLDDMMPDFGEYSIESILEEYRSAGGESDIRESPARTAESIAERSRRIVMESLGETLRQYQKDNDMPWLRPTPQEDIPSAAEAVSAEPAADSDSLPIQPETEEPEPEPDSDKTEEPAEKKRPKISVGEDGIITLVYETEEPEETPEEESPEEENPASDREEPAAAEPTPQPTAPRTKARAAAHTKSPAGGRETFRQRFMAPVIRLIATKAARRQIQRAEAANWPEPVDDRETPELSPKKAARYYLSQAKPLRFRCRVAAFLCLILAWVSFRFPMAGMLGVSLRLQAGVCVVLTLSVMIAALDIVSAGLRQLFSLHPCAEALAVLASVLSCIDGVLVMLGYGTMLPFCAIGAISLTAALWGERLGCTALRHTFKTAASTKSPAILTVEENIDRGASGLLRSSRSAEGIVRRSEEPDLCQTTYAAASPILLAAAFVLSVLASLNGKGGYFLHTFSALLSVSASFSAFFGFSLPYALTSRKLRDSGAAIAGYAGCADIGKTRRIVISDSDIFPPSTTKLSGINILEGAFVDKVISYTASLLAAAGSGAAGVFHELVTRRGYSIVDVGNYKCHEGGGLSATIGGESVLVGSAGFMNLMGIRLPQNLNAKNAICTSIMGELVGVFTVEYIPVSSVQDALVTLLRGRTQTIFAIRDFNITPLLIRQMFRMPTDNFNFPSFRDRYRIAAAAARRDSAPAAVLARSGMMPMVDAAEQGRKLYKACRINTVLSLIGTVVGMIIMFLLCRAASFDTATVGNMLSFMLLWALPVIILSVGQSR